MDPNDLESIDDDLEFTIARGISSSKVLNAVREYFQQQTAEDVKVDRQSLNTSLPDEFQLSKRDAECLFTGLVLNGAAAQVGNARTFADYTFAVHVNQAVVILDAQRIARSALDDAEELNNERPKTTVEFTATFPPTMDPHPTDQVRPLSNDLRRLFFDADSVVRIANPYFDPAPPVIEYIASLSNRGVETKILTRETEAASRKLRQALNMLHEQIEPTNRNSLQVRDCYESDDDTGKQSYATHAKIAIADEELCYVGSANLTGHSLTSNFELGVLLREDSVGVAIDIFDAVFEFSNRVDLPI